MRELAVVLGSNPGIFVGFPEGIVIEPGFVFLLVTPNLPPATVVVVVVDFVDCITLSPFGFLVLARKVCPHLPVEAVVTRSSFTFFDDLVFAVVTLTV